jgi:ABC-type Fe3+ transport system substrate-binding protein
MKNKYFSSDDTLWTITEKYPETIPVFVSQGFSQMGDSAKRKAFGVAVSLKTALALKKLNIDTFSSALVERIEQEQDIADASLKTETGKKNRDALRVEGLLPCPVRIPLTEQLENFVAKYKETYNQDVQHDLKAASMGLDWLKKLVINEEDPGKLPDIFISAGFDLFFEKELMGKFKQKNVFCDSTGFETLNPLFDNDRVRLKDPAGHYSMIGVVPAIFLVNTEELKGRSIPETWQDILKPEFEKSISLPIGDFDLFNAILLNLYKNYGEASIHKLGTSLMQSMHPSQMVKSDRKKSEKPVVTIMPYFFTKMVKESGAMTAVWPQDGAIISPIFMLTKKSKIDKLQPIIDFFASREVGEILAHKGLFPSTHPEVDNRLPAENRFMWLGWDYIYNHDIGQLIDTCDSIFNAAANENKELKN